MPKFKFEVGHFVIIRVSGEEGQIIGRAEYISGENTYLLHYKANDGRAVEQWWREASLVLQ